MTQPSMPSVSYYKYFIRMHDGNLITVHNADSASVDTEGFLQLWQNGHLMYMANSSAWAYYWQEGAGVTWPQPTIP